MLLTPHTLVGIALGAAMPNIQTAVPLAFLMHFAGDLVPHWDFYTGVKEDEFDKGYRNLAVMADLVLGVGIGVYFTLHALWLNKDPYLAASIFLSGIAAVLPDALIAPVIFKSPRTEPKGIFGLVYRIQGKLQISAPLPWGVFTQVLVMLVSFLVISSSIKL